MQTLQLHTVLSIKHLYAVMGLSYLSWLSLIGKEGEGYDKLGTSEFD